MKQPIIGIIGGKGKMGKYFADFFERNSFKVLISDKKTPLSNIQLAKKADVVIVAVPIRRTREIIEEVAPHIKKTGVLFDLTSLKVFPLEAMKKVKGEYFGCHPLFGPTNPIEGQLVILCSGRGVKWMNWWQKLLEKNKVIVKKMNAKKHDRLMAYVQVLTHFSDIAMADTLRKSKIPIQEMIAVESPVYRLEMDMMGRILNQDPKLYADIQINNPLSDKVMRDFVESCQNLTEIVRKKEGKAFTVFFQKGSRYLGDFSQQAQTESDRLIREMLGSGLPAQEPPKDLKKKYGLAILGPQNTYSDQAAKRFRPKAKVWHTASISEVFTLVRGGRIESGLVPVNNSTTGPVREALDELYEGGVWITAMTSLPIHLSLVGIKKVSKNKIRVIYSHPQPLLQCRRYLKKYFPKAITLPVSSTAAALARVAKEKSSEVVAIGSAASAKTYGLKIIQPSIEDSKNNTTHFALIQKTPKRPDLKGAKKTTIAFHFKKDSPGSLFEILQEFAQAKINLTKIESRPNPKISGEYVFFIDFDGTINQPHVKKALERIKKKVARLKILGCY